MSQNKLRVTFAAGVFAASCTAALAQMPGATAQMTSDDGAWRIVDSATPEVEALTRWVRPAGALVVQLDTDLIGATLAVAPHEFTPEAQDNPLIILLPRPDGGFEHFRVEESPVMAPELAARYPWIKTYRGRGVEDRAASVRLDWTHHGFHAAVRTPHGGWYIDPYSQGDVTTYSVYWTRGYLPEDAAFFCDFIDETPEIEKPETDLDDGLSVRTGSTLRIYAMAVAATGEYTNFHGGSVADGQAAIVTAINRITGIYEIEVTARFELVANNDSVVYTNAGSDPYTNGDVVTMLSENDSNLDAVIGSSNYDIGHVFGTGGGGVAQLGVVCGGSKGRGVSTSFSPNGDGFWVNIVAHEMGHQFGASHSFNGTGGSCGSNRSAAHAYEPGSGSTIMSYAGICGADNIQSDSDDYFHADSWNSIRGLMSSISCNTTLSTGNNGPSVDAGLDYTIPTETPFVLHATGADDEGDDVYFTWDQMDLGPAQTLNASDNGSSPLFRSRPPRLGDFRFMPRLPDIRTAGNVSKEEELPKTDRVVTFRVMARDFVFGANRDTMVLDVVGTAGPFKVTFPDAPTILGAGSHTVTWDVAGTSAAPINTSLVTISLSTDQGRTFTPLVENTPNDGSESVVIPSLDTPDARIKVEAVDNIYFDMSDENFTITPGCPEDLDNDGVVGLGDLALVLSSFEVDSGGDVDGDGDTDLSDLAQVLAVFDQPC